MPLRPVLRLQDCWSPEVHRIWCILYGDLSMFWGKAIFYLRKGGYRGGGFGVEFRGGSLGVGVQGFSVQAWVFGLGL